MVDARSRCSMRYVPYGMHDHTTFYAQSFYHASYIYPDNPINDTLFKVNYIEYKYQTHQSFQLLKVIHPNLKPKAI